MTITHPGRPVIAGSDVTKGQLAAYYAAMAPAILRVAARRPVSLFRCPQGRDKRCFFQKHDDGSFGPHVKHVDIREKDGAAAPYIYVEDADGLVACVQMGTVEFHGWGARIDDVERPDRLVFDLDPDEELAFDVVKAAAFDLKTHLAATGLASFAMLSGGKGIHVVVPLTPGAEWPRVGDFAGDFARARAIDEPARFTATMARAKRKGKIFIDWLRNRRGATAVMPYTVRARAGAPVAVPVGWSELGGIDTAARWHVEDRDELAARAASAALRDWGTGVQTLPDP